MSKDPAVPSNPRPAARKVLYLVTSLGLVASLFGFVQAYIWLPKSDAGFAGFVLVTIGLIAATYGFIQAYRAITAWRPMPGNPWVASVMTTAGLVSSAYGFVWAYRGLGMVSDSTIRLAAYFLVGAGALGALFGFVKAYCTIWRQSRGLKSSSSPATS